MQRQEVDLPRNPSGEAGEGRGLGASRPFAGGLAGPFLGKGIDFGGEPLGLIGVGIEVVTDPLCKFVVALMFGVFDGLDQLSVAGGTAAILRRAAAADFGQARVDHAGFRICKPLDLDRMLPAVAEVIEILQRLCPEVFEHVAKPGLAGVEKVVAPIYVGIGRAPSDVARADLIEVGVGPAHGRLDREMQTVEPDIERHLEAAQNWGPDVVEGDLETGDGVGTHATSLRRSISAAQFDGKSSSGLWIA